MIPQASSIRLYFANVLLLFTPVLASAQHIADIEHYIKAHSDTVRGHFGDPDKIFFSEATAAEIWTYYQDASDPANKSDSPLSVPLDSVVFNMALAPQRLDTVRARAGFTQFAFWNGHVAAVSYAQTDAKALSLYDRSIAYLEEHANWLGSGGGMPTYRITRIGDNTWMAYKTPTKAQAQTMLIVGDARYLMCSKSDNSAERERIKRQFGLQLQSN